MQAAIDWQPSLFDGGPLALDCEYGGLRRIQLDEQSWVDYCPGWLSGSDLVFDDLAGEARWQQRERWMYDRKVLDPRLTAGWSTDAADDPASGNGVPPVLREMAEVLSKRYAVGFDRILGLGAKVDGQTVLCRVHARTEEMAADATQRLLAAYTITDGPAPAHPLIADYVPPTEA